MVATYAATVTMEEFLLPEISTRPLRVVDAFEGGVGRVYIVKAPNGQRYALKTLKWELGTDKNLLADEAAKLVELPNHPNIIRISGLFWHEGSPYICMPYCKSSLSDQTSPGERVDPQFALEVIRQVSRGLACLHNQLGMLHLDLKPQNILVSEDGNYLISDFGIAQRLPRPTPSGLHAKLFVSGITGTIAYMSPEHFVSNELSTKSDIFALGVILFELLTGRHPFLADTLEQTIQNIIAKQPRFSIRERSAIPRLLRQVCTKCLEKNPDRRPPADEILKTAGHEAAGSAETENESERRSIDIASTHDKATVLMQLGRTAEAQQLLERCLTENPWYLPSIVTLAELHFHEGRIDVATKFAENALTASDWSLDAKGLGSLLSNLASYYLSMNPERSMEYARKANNLDPHDWQALGNLAEACRVLGEARNRPELIEEGLSATRKALQLNPNDVKLRVNYCGLLLAARDFDTLSPYIVKLVNEVGGDSISLRVTFIRTLIATGQLEDAKRWLKPMREYEPLEPIVSQLNRDIIDSEAELA